MNGHFTKNTLITFSSQIFIFLLGMGTSIITARILGPEGKGMLSLSLLLPGFIVCFSNLGLGHASVYYIGKQRYAPKEIFGNNLISTAVLSVSSILLGLGIISLFGSTIFAGVSSDFLLLSLCLIPAQLLIMLTLSIFLGLQKFIKYNSIQIVRISVSFILLSIFLWGLRFGVKAAIGIEICAYFAAATILFLILYRETRGISFRPSQRYFKDFLSYGSKFNIGSVFLFLYRQINIPIINVFLNPRMVGFYALSMGLSEKIWLISDAVGTTLFPRVSSEKDEEKLKQFTPLVFRNVLLIILVLITFLYIVAYWLITLVYSDAFISSVKPFRILIIGIAAFSGWRILENDLKGRGKPMVNTYIIGVSVTLNILLTILFVPRFGIIGAAWATTISYIITLLIGITAYCRLSGNTITQMFIFGKNDWDVYKTFAYRLKAKIQNR